MNAGIDMYKTRIDEFWHGTEKDSVITGVMHPSDYNSLKKDKEYIFFLKTQRNLIRWYVDYPLRDATLHGTGLKESIEKELEQIDK